MKFNLPKIYPITDTNISGLSHAEQVNRLLAGGATLIQLREKHLTPLSFYNEAAEAKRLCGTARATLLINDRVDVALALRADGVHLGQSDMPVEAARRLLGEDAIIGFSTHNIEQVKAALSLPIDYLAFGPIYATATKQNPEPIAGLVELRRAKSLAASLPVVAIGGISEQNVRDVLWAGADSVAVISQLLTPPSTIAQNLRKLNSIAES